MVRKRHQSKNKFGSEVAKIFLLPEKYPFEFEFGSENWQVLKAKGLFGNSLYLQSIVGLSYKLRNNKKIFL